MCNKPARLRGLVVLAALSYLGGAQDARGQISVAPTIPKDATEESLVRQLRETAKPDPSQSGSQGVPPAASALLIRTVKNHRTLAYAEALLQRFPTSSFRDEALAIELATLADLARVQPQYLARLIGLTEEISQSGAQGKLASENAYYAIQGFVLAARLEGMPETRRLRGSVERYKAFLVEQLNSPHRPVVWASLIRNLAALEQVERAETELRKMRREYPDHPATHRAQGEVYRLSGVGKPFRLQYTTPGGRTIRTVDYVGKVLVVHFWATWSEAAMKELPRLIELYQEHKEHGLQLLGVNVDRSRQEIETALRKLNMPWPQYFDRKGLKNDILVGTGVIRIPTYFVVDRLGVLRAIDPGKKLTELIEELLLE